MNTVAISASLVIGFVLGTTLLYLSLRIISRAQRHMARSAAVYLTMLLGGSLIGGGIFYAATEMVSLRPVIAFVIALMCAGICQWAIGCALFRQIELRRGLAIAIPVILIWLLGCISGIPVVIRAEQRALQTRRLLELRVRWRAVMSQFVDLDTMNKPVPESLGDLADDPAFAFGNVSLSDLGYLPEYLAKQGIHGVSQSNDLKNDYPLLWLDSKQDGDVPVVSAGGSCFLIPRTELETRLNDAAAELSAKQARKKIPANQPVEGTR